LGKGVRAVGRRGCARAAAERSKCARAAHTALPRGKGLQPWLHSPPCPPPCLRAHQAGHMRAKGAQAASQRARRPLASHTEEDLPSMQACLARQLCCWEQLPAALTVAGGLGRGVHACRRCLAVGPGRLRCRLGHQGFLLSCAATDPVTKQPQGRAHARRLIRGCNGGCASSAGPCRPSSAITQSLCGP
jgi:hypothetical protein